MIYTPLDKLTVVELEDGKSTVSFDMLKKALTDKPSNMVYCQSQDRLSGIISMGDIARASRDGKDYIAVNREFTRIFSKEYMKARQIFREKERIHALPIIDGNHRLLGAYVRWDDLYCRNMPVPEGTGQVIKNYQCIVLVRPCEMFHERHQLFRVFYGQLSKLTGCIIKQVAYDQVMDYMNVADLVLFVSEDELRGTDTLIKHILHKNVGRGKLKTYRNWIQELKFEFVGEYLRDIKRQGVHVLNLVFQEESVYIDKLNQSIKNKFSALGEKVSSKMPSAMYPQFFDELYTEAYADNIMHLPFSIETGSYNGKLKDHRGEFYNVVNGERYTTGQPKRYQKTIYFIGPCFIYGHYVEDKHTIESLLQNYLNDAKQRVKVVNCGSFYWKEADLVLARIKEMPLKKGDCVVIYIENKSFSDIPELNLMDTLERHHVSADWMIDVATHCNHKMNALYAEAIYDRLTSILEEDAQEQGKGIREEEDFVRTTYIDRYFKAFSPSIYGKIGSIVMNCNPFTYGHRYLIEEALKTADFLIIFVVEEDKSLFTFDERFAMVYDGVRNLSHVMAVPSGPFILSRTTFPEYFIKEADEDIVKNVENDITLFAEKIAPELKISYRFVGEEPEDMVTNEYNCAMKRILPENGIRLIEIPRKKINGRLISASLVRKCLEDDDMETLYGLIPETTRNILFSEDE